MTIPFVKMHGCGNDFVMLDERSQPLGLTPAGVAAIADRHTGIGCDQLIVIEPAETAPTPSCASTTPTARGRRLRQRHPLRRRSLMRETGAATGSSAPSRATLPASTAVPTADRRSTWGRRAWTGATSRWPGRWTRCASTSRRGDAGRASAWAIRTRPSSSPTSTRRDRASSGPALEHDPLFPQRANIGFAQVLDPDSIRLRVWERGAGLTLACGSGACAALVNAHRRGLTGRRAKRHRRRRRAGHRLARRRPRADDRPGRHRLPRRDRARGLSA